MSWTYLTKSFINMAELHQNMAFMAKERLQSRAKSLFLA
jgi:hypothetical protein